MLENLPFGGSLLSAVPYGIFGLIAFVVLAVLLFKYARMLFKIFAVINILALIGSAILIAALVTDVKDLQENFPQADKLFILKDGQKLLAGFRGSLFSQNEAVSYLNRTELEKAQEYYAANNIEALRGSAFKLFIIDKKLFDKDSSTSLPGSSTTVGHILTLLQTENTLGAFVLDTMKRENLPNNPDVQDYVKENLKKDTGISTDDGMRGMLFAQLFSVTAQDPLSLYSEYKKDHLIIYPETITFKLLKLIPESILEGVAKELLSQEQN